MMPFFIGLGSLLGVCVIGYFIASFIIYRMTFWNEDKYKDLSRVVLEGEEYDPYHDSMVRTIEEAIAIPVTEEIRI